MADSPTVAMQQHHTRVRPGTDHELELVTLDKTSVDAFLALPEPERGVKTVFFSADGMRRARRHLGLYDADTEQVA